MTLINHQNKPTFIYKKNSADHIFINIKAQYPTKNVQITFSLSNSEFVLIFKALGTVLQDLF